MSDSNIDIVFSIDKKYRHDLAIVINSIYKSCDKDKDTSYDLFFHILVDNHETKKQLSHNLKLLDDICIYEIKVLDDNHKDIITKYMRVVEQGLNIDNIMNFARFFLPYYFDLSKVLYLDSDIIVNRDISELYELDFDNNYFMAKTIDEQTRYFNAGIYLTDFEYWKKHNITNKCIDIMKRHKESKQGLFKHGTQPILNMIFKDNYTELNPLWNVTGLGHNNNISKDILDNAYILHWTGKNKPIKNSFKHYSNYFYKYDLKITC